MTARDRVGDDTHAAIELSRRRRDREQLVAQVSAALWDHEDRLPVEPVADTPARRRLDRMHERLAETRAKDCGDLYDVGGVAWDYITAVDSGDSEKAIRAARLRWMAAANLAAVDVGDEYIAEYSKVVEQVAEERRARGELRRAVAARAVAEYFDERAADDAEPRPATLAGGDRIVDVIRCRRIEVIDDDGFERITIANREHGGTDGAGVLVRMRADSGTGTEAGYVKLMADESDYPMVGAFLGYGGNGVADLSVSTGADKGEQVQLEMGHITGEPGIVVDVEGVKNAPMRLYAERQDIERRYSR